MQKHAGMIGVCVVVERKYIFSPLRAENEHTLVAFLAGKAAAAC